MADVRLPQGDETIESKSHSHHSTAAGEKDSSQRRVGLLSHHNYKNTGSVQAWAPCPPAENRETTSLPPDALESADRAAVEGTEGL